MDMIDKGFEPDTDTQKQFLGVLERSEISTVFQPIVSLRDGSVYGYEALSRGPANTEMESPDMLFKYAQIYDKVWDLDLLCREKAIEAQYGMNTKTKLFLNVNPNIMHDIKFKQGFTKEYLSQYEMSPENIIFEITEREAINNNSGFMKAIRNYKNQNYEIAIDDAGAGYSGLNLISDINPHYIKLDMNLIRNIDKDLTKYSLVKSLADFAALTNTHLIAEGIETESELLKLIDIGVQYGQGFYFKKPSPEMGQIDDDIVEKIKATNHKRNHLCDGDKGLCGVYISNICSTLMTVNPNILTSQVYEIEMEKDSRLPGLCITESGYAIGVITRSELYKYLSGQYGYTLHLRKAIKDIMRKDFLKVDYQDSIETVAQKAMKRDMSCIYDFITVTKENQYFGIVTVKDLLESSIQIQVNHAKHLNPLSELPGNILIEKQLEICLNSEIEYTVLYFDINNFKSYNDVYGFENGDRILKLLAKILKKNIPENAFIGHIGGDDFVAVLSDTDYEGICTSIMNEFDWSISSFYNYNDLNRGYIIAKNRHGIEETFPLLSISIACISSKNHKTIYDLSERVAELKAVCKQKCGSSYVIGV